MQIIVTPAQLNLLLHRLNNGMPKTVFKIVMGRKYAKVQHLLSDGSWLTGVWVDMTNGHMYVSTASGNRPKRPTHSIMEPELIATDLSDVKNEG